MRTFLLLIVRKVCQKCHRNIWRLKDFENYLLLSFSPRKHLTLFNEWQWRLKDSENFLLLTCWSTKTIVTWPEGPLIWSLVWCTVLIIFRINHADVKMLNPVHPDVTQCMQIILKVLLLEEWCQYKRLGHGRSLTTWTLNGLWPWRLWPLKLR